MAPRARALVVAVLVLAACSNGDPVAPRPGGDPAAPGEGLHPALIYLDGTTLFGYDLESGDSTELAALPSADVTISPDGARYAAVEETHPAGPGHEGFRDPVVVVGEVFGEGGPVELGPGRVPLFSPDGQAVAALASSGVEVCAPLGDEGLEREGHDEGECFEGEEVVVYDATRPDEPPEALVGPGAWSLLGWTSERRVFASSLIDEATVLAGDGTEELPFAPAEVWGVAPTQATVLVVREEGAALAGDGETAVDLGDALLGDGAWSPDGAHVAGVAVEIGGVRPSTHLVLIDARSGDVDVFPAGDEAQGMVTWAEDSRSFAFARVDPDDDTRLQAVVCTIELDCDAHFSWDEGIALLALVT